MIYRRSVERALGDSHWVRAVSWDGERFVGAVRTEPIPLMCLDAPFVFVTPITPPLLDVRLELLSKMPPDERSPKYVPHQIYDSCKTHWLMFVVAVEMFDVLFLKNIEGRMLVDYFSRLIFIVPFPRIYTEET